MDSIETFGDKMHFLSLMDYTVEEIDAHIDNGTAELLADIEGIEGLHYASPPSGGWVLRWSEDDFEIHSDVNKADRVQEHEGGHMTFDLFAVPTHDYYPVTERPLVDGRYQTYGKVS